MIFNSFAFALFLPTVFAIYWLSAPRGWGLQNIVIIAASAFFYAWWDWRFFGLILFCGCFNYAVALSLPALPSPRARKALLVATICVNFGLLGFFKYFNFFAENLAGACGLLGIHLDAVTLRIILPVGISFHTFQTMSYTIDVYRGRLAPTRNLGAMLAYVCYFPQLLAGPIERATNLLPQFHRNRHFSYEQAVDGLRQMLWGFFKKIVVADSCATCVNAIFSDYTHQPGSVLLLGSFLFACQIYGDFSGYTDIALGCSRLFGINLMQNFAYPYFSRDIAEFWRRWHISLTTWFRDYVYYPLGGSRVGLARSIRNTSIVFLVSGLWHGANWTFVAWGALNAVYFLPLLVLRRNRHHVDTVVAADRFWPKPVEVAQMAGTFGLTLVAWVFFRAETVGQAVDYLARMFDASLFSVPQSFRSPLLPIIGMFAVEWLQRRKPHGLEIKTLPCSARWTAYASLTFLCLLMFQRQSEFIYFQF